MNKSKSMADGSFRLHSQCTVPSLKQGHKNKLLEQIKSTKLDKQKTEISFAALETLATNLKTKTSSKKDNQKVKGKLLGLKTKWKSKYSRINLADTLQPDTRIGRTRVSKLESKRGSELSTSKPNLGLK